MSYIPPPVGGSREYIPNHLVWSILSTLFCCLPLGIVSIVYASQVDGKRAAGDIAGARENPEMMQRAFDEIDAALADGQIVGIFPEGALSRDGEIAPFKSGVEHVLERANESGRPVPVIPMALKGMWTSMWSHRDGRMRRMRLPRRFRAHVEVMAGEPIDGRGTSAEQLEARVRELRGADA